MQRRAMRARGRRFVLAVGCLLAAWPAAAQFQKMPWTGPQPVLDFQDLQGHVWNADSLRGKAVVLNFWATWCAPCKEEMPSLQTLHELGAGDPLILGLNVRETASHVGRYVRSSGLQLPVVLDPRGETAKRWGVTAYPTTILIGADGRVRWRVVGAVDWTGPEAAGWLQGLQAARP